MTKRSALWLSAGAAVALVAIVAALALNLGALRAGSASAAQSTQKPIVKTIVKTIHHTAKPKAKAGGSGSVQTIVVQRPSSSLSSSASTGSHDDGFESEHEGSGGGDD